jgi:uncharacterized protein (TIGR02118 family)
MIRLTFVLRRKSETSLAEFQRYWREKHGPLVAKNARALNMLRYVQVHTLDDPVNAQIADARGGMETPYDGVAEVWWNHRDEVVAALGTPEGQVAGEELLEDEKRFIDLANSPLWFNHEYPQVNPTPENLVATEGSSLIKLFYCLRHPSTQTMEEAQLDWRTNHGPLIRSQAQAARILRYVQVHRYEDELERILRETRGTEIEPYTGHAELWLDRNELALGSPERSRGARLAVEDERRFVDFSRSAAWIAKERVFVDHR